MRPAPTTASPSCLRWSIVRLLRLDSGFAREPALLVELRPDMPAELLGRRARLELDAALDEALVQIRSAHGLGDRTVQADQRPPTRSLPHHHPVHRHPLLPLHPPLR